MDYMKLDGFMGGVISRFINKAIENKFGESPCIRISELNVRETSGRTQGDTIEVNATLRMSKDDFQMFVEEVTK